MPNIINLVSLGDLLFNVSVESKLLQKVLRGTQGVDILNQEVSALLVHCIDLQTVEHVTRLLYV